MKELKPLIISFQNSTKSSHYPDIWKKSNIIPVHRKNDKQLVKTTDQYLFYLFLENYLKKLYSVEFITFCCRRNYEILTSLVFVHLTRA